MRGHIAVLIIGNLIAVALGVTIGLQHGEVEGMAVGYIISLLVDIRFFIKKEFDK